jgi:hypothetical protein
LQTLSACSLLQSSEWSVCLLSALACVGCSALALAALNGDKKTDVGLTVVASLLTLLGVLLASALVQCAWKQALLALIAFHSLVPPFALLIRQ